MATTRSREKRIKKPGVNRIDGILKQTEQPLPVSVPDPSVRTTWQTIRWALQSLLQTLSITPSGQAEVPALQHRLFQVTAPRTGLNVTIPNPIPFNDPFTLPVTPDVRWDVLDEEGKTLPSGYRFVADPPALNAPEVQMLFFPQVVKDNVDAPKSVTLQVRALVSLTATHPTTGEVITMPAKGRTSLTPVTVTVPVALRIPSILAFFRHKSFASRVGNRKGFALVFLPPGSSITSVEDLGGEGKLGDLIEEVGRLRTAIEALPVAQQSHLAVFAGNLEGFLDGLDSLVRSLASFGHPFDAPISIRRERSNSNLNMAELLPGILNDFEREAEISSLIFVGLGETVRLYNKTTFRKGRGILQIETGPQMCAVVDRLNRALPTITIGDPTITMPKPANFSSLRLRRTDTFNNAIASFHFGKGPPT